MLIRPQQALSLARNDKKHFIVTYIFKDIRHTSIIKRFTSGKRKHSIRLCYVIYILLKDIIFY